MTTAVLAAALRALGETPPDHFAVVTPDDTRRRLLSTRRPSWRELSVRRDLEPKVLNASTPSDPIPWPAAVMSNRDDADQFALQSVNQRIWKTVEGQRPRVASASVTQLGKPVQEAKRSIEFIGELIRCNECAFAGVPIDSSIGIGLRFVAKTYPHRLWRH